MESGRRDGKKGDRIDGRIVREVLGEKKRKWEVEK